jgi:pSer/pThr/pTyr-binding forkhead associated (FHA) protein
MHVVLEVESGLKRGHRVWLRGRQSLSVGATELADFAIPGDPFISHVHFTLHSHQLGCRIADSESAHGTFVNAQPVADCWLHDGDRLQAGRTLFLVRIESWDQRRVPDRRHVVRGLA